MSAGSVCRLGPREISCLDSEGEPFVGHGASFVGTNKEEREMPTGIQKPTLCQGVGCCVWICPHSDRVGRQSNSKTEIRLSKAHGPLPVNPGHEQQIGVISTASPGSRNLTS